MYLVLFANAESVLLAFAIEGPILLESVKKTLGGTNRKAVRVSGFRARMKNHNGKKIISARRKKGRKNLSI